MIGQPRAEHVIWLDGAFVPWHQATMHVSAHHYGFGVFEGVRVYTGASGPAVFRLLDHTKRLFRSARMMKMAIPARFGLEQLNEAQLELARRNHFQDAYLRPFAFLDGLQGLRPCARDLAVHVAILGVDWNANGGDRAAGNASQGVTVNTSTFIRHPANSLHSKAKANGNYLAGMLALQEAQANGADEALLLDSNGFVTETSGSNLFVVKEGEIQTPPVSLVLDGITRDTVLTIAAEAGLRVSERQLTRDEVYVADEVFLTGTASELTPVLRVDGRPIGGGLAGEVTRRLQTLYSNLVRGHAADHRAWLTPVATSQSREALNNGPDSSRFA